MSRPAAATSAGRARTAHRSVAAPVPRRVSGLAAPRRDADGRAPRARIDASALAYSEGALAFGGGPVAYAGGPVAYAGGPVAYAGGPVAYAGGPVAYADSSIAYGGGRAAHTAAPAAYAGGAVVDRYGRPPARRQRVFAAPGAPRLAYGGVAIATRVAGVALDVSASRMMDRVVRGRVWIGVIAVSLIGLVAMQVSMLKLNSGIGRAAQTVSTLERSNSALRSDITRLSAGDRIGRLASAEGLVMPAPGEIAYLRVGSRHEDAARAARRMQAPSPSTVGLAGGETPPGLVAPGATPAGGSPAIAAATAAGAPVTAVAGTTAPATGGAAPMTAAPPAAVTPAPSAPGTTASGTTAPGTTAAGTPAPATTAPATAAPAATQQAATPPTATSSGGATPQATTQTP